MSNDEVLSICIPTMDRTDKLLTTISVFLNQAVSQDLKIYISDNGENELTEKMIKQKFGNDDRLIYFRNENPVKNYQTNFLNLFSKAKGEYLWFFGDDDLPFDYTLKEVLSLVDRSPDFIMVNYVGYDKDLKNILPYWKVKAHESYDIHKDSFVKELISAYPYIGFISFIIMKKKHLLKAIKSSIVDLNSNYIQTFIWAVAILSMDKVNWGINTGKPLVKWREDFGIALKKDRWSKSRFLLSLEYRDIFARLAYDFNIPVLLKAYDGFFQYRLIAMALDWKIKSHISVDDAITAVKQYKNISKSIKLYFLIISLVPKPLLTSSKRFLSQIYKLTEDNFANIQ